MALADSNSQSISSLPTQAAQCSCAQHANSITITDEDLKAIAELRELKPLMSFLRDFARMSGSVLSANRKVIDALKK